MSIADKLTYLQTTKQLLKTEINKINNVLTDESTFRSYPQELFNGYLDVLNNGTDTLWNNLEKVSASGEEATLENVETAPIKMVLNGNTSQDGEPTPDTPVEVKVVKGENVVSVSGKNLIDDYDLINRYNVASVSGNIITSNAINSNYNVIQPKTKTQTINLIENTNYYVSFDCRLKSGSYSAKLGTNIIDGVNGTSWSSGNIAISNPNMTGSYQRYSFKCIATITTKSIIGLTIQVQQNLSNAVFEIKNIMISTSSDDTYVPYSKTDYPINLGDIELCKINTYKDFPFKAINGNEYYDTLTDEQKNALVYGKWYEHKEFDKTILNENSYWYERDVTISGVSRKIFFSRSDKFKSYVSMQNMLCNYFKVKNTYGTSPTANNQFYNNYERTNNLEFAKFEFTTLTEWKEWVASHNIILVGKLATPTETEITDTTLIAQLEAISKAKSVKDKTYITQTNDDLPFILDVEAIKEYEVI